MPTYDYLCDTCTNEFEITCPMGAHMTRTRCPKCGDEAQQTFKKVVTFDDHPTWLNDNVRAQIQGDDRRPIETRSDYVRHCREHNIVVTDRRV
jgi:putative FmdB family regulatory protein